MAYTSPLISQDDEKDKNSQVVGQQTSGQSGVISGSGSSQSVGAPTTDRTSVAKKGSGSNWTNLSTYLDANRGADASMAGGIRDKQQEYSDTAQQNIQTVGENVGSQQQRVTGDVTSGQAVQSQLSKDPTKVSQEDFDKYYNYQYGGPKDVAGVEGYGTAQQSLGKLGTIAEQTKDFSGVGSLLRDAYGRENYSQGENILDAFITQGGEQGQQALSQMRQDYGQQQEQFDEQSGGYQDILNQLGQQSQTLGQGFRSEADASLADYLANVEAAKQGVQGSLSSGIFGQTGGPSTVILGQDQLDEYLTQGQAESANLQALSELMGQDYQVVDWDALAAQAQADAQAEADAQATGWLAETAPQGIAPTQAGQLGTLNVGDVNAPAPELSDEELKRLLANNNIQAGRPGTLNIG